MRKVATIGILVSIAVICAAFLAGWHIPKGDIVINDDETHFTIGWPKLIAITVGGLLAVAVLASRTGRKGQ